MPCRFWCRNTPVKRSRLEKAVGDRRRSIFGNGGVGGGGVDGGGVGRVGGGGDRGGGGGGRVA